MLDRMSILVLIFMEMLYVGLFLNNGYPGNEA